MTFCVYRQKFFFHLWNVTAMNLIHSGQNMQSLNQTNVVRWKFFLSLIQLACLFVYIFIFHPCSCDRWYYTFLFINVIYLHLIINFTYTWSQWISTTSTDLFNYGTLDVWFNVKLVFFSSTFFLLPNPTIFGKICLWMHQMTNRKYFVSTWHYSCFFIHCSL